MPKKGRGLPRPSRWPDMADKILKIFIDHKLHDGERNFEKRTNLNFFPKKGMACHAPQDDPTWRTKCWKFLLVISYKMVKEIWKKDQLKFFPKKGVACHAHQGRQIFFKNFLLIFSLYTTWYNRSFCFNLNSETIYTLIARIILYSKIVYELMHNTTYHDL